MSRDGDSFIDYGAPDPTENVNPVVIDSWPDYYWSLPMDAVKFSDAEDGYHRFQKTDAALYYDEGVYTIFDTAKSSI